MSKEVKQDLKMICDLKDGLKSALEKQEFSGRQIFPISSKVVKEIVNRLEQLHKNFDQYIRNTEGELRKKDTEIEFWKKNLEEKKALEYEDVFTWEKGECYRKGDSEDNEEENEGNS